VPAPGDGDLTSTDLRLGAAAAAGALALLSSGEMVVLVVLLGVAGGHLWTAAVATVAALALALRWGTTSLDAIAGAQSVLGPGGLVGSPAAAACVWCGGLALLLASPRDWTAPAFGLAAALVVAGPAVHSPADLAIKVAVVLVSPALAVAVGRTIRRAVAWPAALGLAVVGVALAVAP
jgi:hypothetical protein